ncbi:hypothetical protein N7535_009188 [Penicillium sp. DV-2018c]|nr:hypothetical protein N7461_002911 [Penicillium sp. DV-2018c]KAJ5560991.1 hypothetical protein N7535_009188 [Penicillium sp. DV-2018c]
MDTKLKRSGWGRPRIGLWLGSLESEGKANLQELSDARKVIDEVSQLSESSDHATHQGKPPTREGTVSTQEAFGPESLAEYESPGHQDSPTIPAPIHYARKAGSPQQVNKDPNGQAPSEDVTVVSPQHDEFAHADGTRQSRLHTSDFIQNLSE